MKIKTSELMTAYEVLKAVVTDGRDKTTKIPVKAVYRLGRLVKALEGEYITLTTKRSELFQKYGEAANDAEGKPTGVWTIKPENMETFVAEWKPLVEDEIEVSCQPLPLSCFGDGDAFLSISEQVALFPFMEEDK